tara:strand:- start:43 stop:525 length:483 start_codon:yes stop_codon:yes gene_type:complete
MANKKLKDVPQVYDDDFLAKLLGVGTIGELPQKGLFGGDISPRQARTEHTASRGGFKTAMGREAKRIKLLQRKWKRNQNPDDKKILDRAIQGFHNTLSREEERLNPEAGMKEPGDPRLLERGRVFGEPRKKGGSVKKQKKKSKVFSGDDFVRKVNNYKEM